MEWHLTGRRHARGKVSSFCRASGVDFISSPGRADRDERYTELFLIISCVCIEVKVFVVLKY